jgi:geranylgeranyl diphosphate synthase type II
MDMDFEERLDVTVNEYLKMIEFKTSVLLAAALQMGAIIGGASNSEHEKIYQFGLNLGLSFQIKDDYLDAFGEGDKVGKRIGGDILRNKKTFLLITALNDADAAQRARLLTLFDEKDEDKKVNGVLELYAELKIKEKSEAKIEELYQKSLESLQSIRVKEEYKEPLKVMAKAVHERDY